MSIINWILWLPQSLKKYHQPYHEVIVDRSAFPPEFGQFVLADRDSDRTETSGNPKEVNGFKNFTARALQAMPAEVIPLYPILLNSLGSDYTEQWTNSLAALGCLFIVVYSRLPLNKNGDGLSKRWAPYFRLIASILVFVCWIYSMSGYIFVETEKVGIFTFGILVFGALASVADRGKASIIGFK